MTHSYYQLTITLESPLSIGSGEDFNTDHDVLLDTSRKPYIPASTLAGVMRRGFCEEDANELFGYINKNDHSQSAVIVYDAKLKSDSSFTVSERDNVALDKYKVAIDRKKFDREVVERGAVFVSLLELDHRVQKHVTTKLEAYLKRVQRDGLYIGAKTNRGMGRVSVNVVRREFNFDSELKAWLDFDPFASDAFEDADVLTVYEGEACTGAITLHMNIENVGAVSIREYLSNKAGIKFTPMRGNVDDQSVVIPGTSWAGAFRHRIASFLQDAEKERALFGDVVRNEDNTTTAYRSHIRFSETTLSGGDFFVLTHNAIDRFSGKVKDGALFSEETYYGGTGELIISLDKSFDEATLRALGAAVLDLHNGYLAVGGMTAVGRGMFRITDLKLNGNTLNLNDMTNGGLLNVLAETGVS